MMEVGMKKKSKRQLHKYARVTEQNTQYTYKRTHYRPHFLMNLIKAFESSPKRVGSSDASS